MMYVRHSPLQLLTLSALFLLFAVRLHAQTADAQPTAPEPSALIGVTLEGLFARLGIPKSVYALRGEAEWQDDVVFVYEAADCYVFKDRVWQLGLKSAYGVKLGDSKPAVLLTLGERVEDEGAVLRLPLPGRGWPLELQINLDASGMVQAIYVYRSDF
jgi:hypothetical protein